VESARSSTVAFVLFPDEFRWEKVISALADLAEQRPKLLPVLVTARPQRFENLTSAPAKTLIVPRPAWGWPILEAIRARLDLPASTNEDRRIPRGLSSGAAFRGEAEEA
jgi:hypothetical protein